MSTQNVQGKTRKEMNLSLFSIPERSKLKLLYFFQICFHRTIEINSLQYPMCKQRIGTWARRSSKTKTLVDIALWDRIKETFPERVQMSLAGIEEDPDQVEEMFPTVATHQYAESGSIRKEFEKELLEIDQEREEKRREEEMLSRKLIESFAQEQRDQDTATPSTSSSSKAPPAKGSILAYVRNSSVVNNGQEESVDGRLSPVFRPSTSRASSATAAAAATSSSSTSVSSGEPDTEPLSSPSLLDPEPEEEPSSDFDVNNENEVELQRQALARFEQARKDAEYAKQLSDEFSSSPPVMQRRSSPKRAASSPAVGQSSAKKKRKGLKQLSLQEMLMRK